MHEPSGSPPAPTVESEPSTDPQRRGPTRPIPDRPLVERLRLWLVWFGVVRLAATSVGVVLVALAFFWLVRSPDPPPEATIPMATDRSGDAAVGAAEVTSASTAAGAAASSLSPTDGASTVASSTADEPIVVHVAGSVNTPGLYRLEGERRVHDAIELAGGGTARADLDAVNLAQPLLDGQRLYVPAVGEIDRVEIVSPPPGTAPVDGGVAPGPIDINRATTDELDTLPGVGPSTARAIVDERDRNGPFATVDDLERVPGIGPTKLDRLRDLVVV